MAAKSATGLKGLTFTVLHVAMVSVSEKLKQQTEQY